MRTLLIILTSAFLLSGCQDKNISNINDTNVSDINDADTHTADTHTADTHTADTHTADTHTADTHTTRHRGHCEEDADCLSGECVVVGESDNPWRACTQDYLEATSCENPEAPDECCERADCTENADGGCFPGPRFECSGAAPIQANSCAYSECGSDADCAVPPGYLGTCVPADTLGEPRAHCVASECHDDIDCTNGTEGECRPFFSPCTNRFTGFACTYAEGECREDADCANNGGYCGSDGAGNTICSEFTPPP